MISLKDTIQMEGHNQLRGSAIRRDSFLVFGAPYIGEAEVAEVVDTLRSGWIGFGPKCLQFEKDFGRYVAAAEAVSLNSCTAGLHLALVDAGVGRGDEVITTPLTFVATANVIEHVGARPVFVDVNRKTQNIDPALIEAAITPRTKAVIPVHMAGRPCDMDAITEIARRHDLVVIEDAAHAIEAAWAGCRVGSMSPYTVFSFYATKNMTTGEGGMLTTSSSKIADRIRVLRLHGLSKDAWKRYSAEGFQPYDTAVPGWKYNMTDLQASLGIHQLARLDENLKIREQIWQAYDGAFADLPGLEIPDPPGPNERHARHLYTLMINEDLLAIDRNRFAAELTDRNIGCGIHFVPVHQHSYYRAKYGRAPVPLRTSEEIGRRTLSLPMSAGLTDQDVKDVIHAVTQIAQQHRLRKRATPLRGQSAVAARAPERQVAASRA